MTMKRISMGYRWPIVGLSVLVCLMAAALLGYGWSAAQARSAAKDANFHIIQWALDIAEEQRSLIFQLSSGTRTPCSEEDIAILRHQIFKARYVGDVARVEQGTLKCSALWGLWSKPYVLPGHRKNTKSGIALWKDLPNPVTPVFQVDIAANDSVAVFTNPGAYGDIQAHLGEVRARIYARDGKYVYKEIDTTVARGSAPDFLSALWITGMAKNCAPANGPDICSESRVRVDGRFPMLIAGLAGAALGAAIGMALLLWWRGSFGLRASLLEALQQRKIRIEYQPLRALATGRVMGAEALARWTHGEAGPISPATFIPWVESLGLQQAFTRYVVRSALDGVQELLTREAAFYLSINIFPANLEDDTFFGFLLDSVKSRKIEPSRIVLEITESVEFVSKTPAELFKRYRDAGFRIFLDDFGVGYSNLGSLMRWSIDGVKLDRLFVQSIGDFSGTVPVLDQVLEMAKQLHLLLVIEGIETQDQADFILKRAPHAVGQGWLLGRPGAASQLEMGVGTAEPERVDRMSGGGRFGAESLPVL
ncbi:MAG: EAL domain-containing protein [Acidovorax sp.]